MKDGRCEMVDWLAVEIVNLKMMTYLVDTVRVVCSTPDMQHLVSADLGGYIPCCM